MVSEKLKLYRECVSKGLKGKKFETREKRWAAFCVLSKLCSGRAKTPEEAISLCKAKHPELY